MGKKLKVIIFGASIIIAGSIVTNAIAGTLGEPGSVDDPIVTKSYVDEQIQIKVGEEFSKLQQEEQPQGTIQGSQLTVEKLDTGKIIVANEGSEIILRGGSAVAYGEGPNGIPDLTGGQDLKIGSAIPKNHYLLIPRTDGRGIKITSGPAYVMIRGVYEIK